jgi:hypothetical protein
MIRSFISLYEKRFSVRPSIGEIKRKADALRNEQDQVLLLFARVVNALDAINGLPTCSDEQKRASMESVLRSAGEIR